MSSWPKTVFIYTDGACRGNPGPCSLGLEVLDERKQLIYKEKAFLESYNTNNFAEYKAVIRALELANQHKIQTLTLCSDSQLLIRQLNRQYKVKSSNIKTLFEQCNKLSKNIPNIFWKHIFREQNQGADALANEALDDNFNQK